MASPCPRCGHPLDADGVCASCAFAGVLDDPVASAFPLDLEDAAQRISKRRRLVDLEPLGKGGMGFVFRARQAQLDRDVALKLFSSGSHERFEREARLLASLSHPNIVAIHDYGSEDGTPYIVMEFMDGPSLRTLIDMGGLSRIRAIEILEQAARAIEYAHSRGVIHRDIKPENVLTSVDGTVKVGDFGIARLADQEGDPGGGSGTPEYMAPERRHVPCAADERSDIYSLGALAREMLAGSSDDRLDDIVRRALDPDPNRRFQTAGEFLSELRSLASRPGSSPSVLPWDVRVRRLSLSRLFWFFLASSVVEIAALIVWMTTFAQVQPQDLFDSLLDDPQVAINLRGALRTLSELPLEEIDALLAREASSPDLRRAAMALEIACRRKRQSLISPEDRIRILRALPWNVSPLGAEGSLYVTNRPWVLASTLKDGGPALGRRFAEELASGTAPPSDLPLLTIGIAWTADGGLCLDLRNRLLETPRPANAHLLLTALAARLDIPIPSGPEVTPVYERYLPELLDASGEALWEVAARLVQELPETDDVSDWKSLFLPLRGGPLTPANLASGRDFQWPFKSDGYVRGFEASIRADQWRKNSEYLLAVMTRWHETGRMTLPHFPYGSNKVLFQFLQPPIENLQRVLKHQRFNSDARAILLPGASMPWECVYLGFTTLAGRPEVLARGRGVGKVDFTGSFEVPAPGTPVRGSIGIGSLVPQPERSARGGIVSLSGDFSMGYPGALRFDGVQSSRDPYGGGSGSASGLSAAGETMVVQCSVFTFHGRSFRSGYAWLLFPDPSPGLDPETRWRVGIRAAATRLAASSPSHLSNFDIAELTSFAMVTPIPEATDGLRKLWERRSEFEDHDLMPGLIRVKTSDAVGASLLMAGDPTPLIDKGLVDRLPFNLASRIFLFSSSAEVRTAVAERARQTLGRDDAEAVARILTARGDTTSPLAQEAAAGMARGRKELLLEIAPYAAVGVVLLILGWIPRNRGYLPGIAASLAHTGLLFRLVKLQVGDALWIPVVGDVLLLISAFLYGSVALRLLTTGMMVTAILQLMLPQSQVLGFVTFVFLCAYLAIASLDVLSRQLPDRLPRRFGIAFLATWWLLIVPCVVMTSAALFQAAPNIAQVTGVLSAPAAVSVAAGLVLPPLWLMNFERRRRLAEAATS